MDIETRLCRLETSLRRWKFISLALLLFLTVGIYWGGKTTAPTSLDVTSITTRDLIVRDKDDGASIVLQADPEYATLRMSCRPTNAAHIEMYVAQGDAQNPQPPTARFAVSAQETPGATRYAVGFGADDHGAKLGISEMKDMKTKMLFSAPDKK